MFGDFLIFLQKFCCKHKYEYVNHIYKSYYNSSCYYDCSGELMRYSYDTIVAVCCRNCGRIKYIIISGKIPTTTLIDMYTYTW